MITHTHEHLTCDIRYLCLLLYTLSSHYPLVNHIPKEFFFISKVIAWQIINKSKVIAFIPPSEKFLLDIGNWRVTYTNILIYPKGETDFFLPAPLLISVSGSRFSGSGPGPGYCSGQANCFPCTVRAFPLVRSGPGSGPVPHTSERSERV